MDNEEVIGDVKAGSPAAKRAKVESTPKVMVFSTPTGVDAGSNERLQIAQSVQKELFEGGEDGDEAKSEGEDIGKKKTRTKTTMTVAQAVGAQQQPWSL